MNTLKAVMPVATFIAFLVICAALVEGQAAQREYGDDAPSLAFKGPLAPLRLSPAQIKIVQKGIAESLVDPRLPALAAATEQPRATRMN